MADVPPAPSFRLGPLIGAVAGVFLRNAAPILALNIVPSIPTLAVMAATGGPPAESALANLVPTILDPILSLFILALTADGTWRSLHGGPFLTGEAAGRALRRFLPLVGASILSWLLVMAGLAAFIIPGLMAIATLFVVVPVCVVETRGSVESMERAARLTRGHRWRLFALFAVTALPMLAASALLGDFDPQLPSSVFSVIGDEAVSLFYLAVAGVTFGVSYDALRALDEGSAAGRLVLAFE